MRWIEKLFLAFVLISACVFAAFIFSRSASETPSPATVAPASAGSAGVPRAVDMNKFKDRMRGKSLSGHEAMFYKKLGEPPQPAEGKDKDKKNDDK